MDVTYNGQTYDVKRFYFGDSATLVAGQPLCFQENPDTTAADYGKGFPFTVQLPGSGNALIFAGIVAPESVGFTGPGYVSVIVPKAGDILQVLVSDDEAVAVGDLLYLDYDVLTAEGADSDGAFEKLILATAAASTTAAAINGYIIDGVKKGVCVAMQSLASTDSVSRHLKWVKFL